MGPNNPCVVWGSCFLWLASLITIAWSLILLFYMGDMLLITQTDIVIALLLLSGIIMLPTNCFMIYSIANGERIYHQSKVFCCPIWMLITWIIIINVVGVSICFHRLYMCALNTENSIEVSMRHYRNVPRYKHFMDNVQWTLKCCGLESYKDWFHHNWYDRLRDYEWDSNYNSSDARKDRDVTVSDSVPLSCCKSGACVPNYLLELGTHSINTKGCGKAMYHLYMLSMNIYLVLFFLIVIIEVEK